MVSERKVPDIIMEMGKRLILYGIQQKYIMEHYDSDTLDMMEYMWFMSEFEISEKILQKTIL
jgi:hypothetical protein